MSWRLLNRDVLGNEVWASTTKKFFSDRRLSKLKSPLDEWFYFRLLFASDGHNNIENDISVIWAETVEGHQDKPTLADVKGWIDNLAAAKLVEIDTDLKIIHVRNLRGISKKKAMPL